MQYRNQRACRVQPLSAEMILWITGHSSMDLQSRGSVHIWTTHWQKVRGIGTPGSPPLHLKLTAIHGCTCKTEICEVGLEHWRSRKKCLGWGGGEWPHQQWQRGIEEVREVYFFPFPSISPLSLSSLLFHIYFRPFKYSQRVWGALYCKLPPTGSGTEPQR